MSYDVTIGHANFNYTSNVSALFYDHFPNGKGLRGIHGMTGRQAAIEIGRAFEAMNNTRYQLYVDHVPGEPRMEQRYNAKNGWGSMAGALMFLGQIAGACARYPRHRVNVDA